MTHSTGPSSQDGPQPRIYVACLAAYNHAILHGRWMDADEDLDDLRDQIQQMLEASPCPGAEEFAIHDHEGFGGVEVGEFASLEHVHEAARLIAEHRELAHLALEHCGGLEHVREAERVLEENYQGAYSSKEDWAFELLEETGLWAQIPEHLHPYLDLESYARDLELSGHYSACWARGQWHVFLDG